MEHFNFHVPCFVEHSWNRVVILLDHFWQTIVNASLFINNSELYYFVFWILDLISFLDCYISCFQFNSIGILISPKGISKTRGAIYIYFLLPTPLNRIEFRQQPSKQRIPNSTTEKILLFFVLINIFPFSFSSFPFLIYDFLFHFFSSSSHTLFPIW